MFFKKLKNLVKGAYIGSAFLSLLFFSSESEARDMKLSEFSMDTQTAICLPVNGKRTLEESIAITGILDTELISKISSELKNENPSLTEKYPKPEKGKKGVIAYTSQKIPANLDLEDTIIDSDTLEIKAYPEIVLETEVNIPAFKWRIYEIEDQERILITELPIAVGMPSRKSVRGNFMLDEIQHYPSWKDPEKKKSRAVPPGPKNPLGLWKVLDHRYAGHWYFHGTNQEKLLNNENRAISHGCHRNKNDNIAYVAGFLLARYSDKLEVFDMPLSAGTKTVRLNAKIPTTKKYDTIEVFTSKNHSDSYILFYPNVYGFSAESEFIQLTNLEHLKKDIISSGFDYAQFDEQRLKELVKKAAKTKKEINVNVKDYLR